MHLTPRTLPREECAVFRWIRVDNDQGGRLTRVVDESAMVRLTTGFLRMPTEERTTLNVYASSFAGQVVPVDVRVERRGGDGRKSNLLTRRLLVPPAGGVHASIPAPAGDIVEVTVSVPRAMRPFILPSATVTQYFPADGATTPILTLAAGDFAAADGATAALPSTRWVGSGLIDISQGVAAARPEIRLWLSNLTSEQQRVSLVVHRLVRGTDRKESAVSRTVTVAGAEAVEVLLPTTEVEGRTIEVLLELPGGVSAALDAIVRFLADDSISPDFSLGFADFALVVRR